MPTHIENIEPIIDTINKFSDKYRGQANGDYEIDFDTLNVSVNFGMDGADLFMSNVCTNHNHVLARAREQGMCTPQYFYITLPVEHSYGMAEFEDRLRERSSSGRVLLLPNFISPYESWTLISWDAEKKYPDMIMYDN